MYLDSEDGRAGRGSLGGKAPVWGRAQSLLTAAGRQQQLAGVSKGEEGRGREGQGGREGPALVGPCAPGRRIRTLRQDDRDERLSSDCPVTVLERPGTANPTHVVWRLDSVPYTTRDVRLVAEAPSGMPRCETGSPSLSKRLVRVDGSQALLHVGCPAASSLTEVMCTSRRK